MLLKLGVIIYVLCDGNVVYNAVNDYAVIVSCIVSGYRECDLGRAIRCIGKIRR